MKPNDLMKSIERYKGKLYIHLIQQDLKSYQLLASLNNKSIPIQPSDFYNFTNYLVKTKNIQTGNYEKIDYNDPTIVQHINNYDINDMIYETQLDKIYEYLITQLAYTTANIIFPFNDHFANSPSFYKQTFITLESITTINNLNQEYDAIKYAINFFIDQFLQENEEGVNNTSVAQILNSLSYNNLKII